jgi:hypothetical protein
MPIKQLPHAGWENNLQLANEYAELIISLDVGPRVLSYRTPGGPNVLKVYPDQLGGSGENKWMIRGGHRLWIAPEHQELSYVPDNAPVQFELKQPAGVRLQNAPVAPWGIRKTLDISLATDSPAVTVVHTATNESDKPVTMATWGLTVMAPGGLEIIPVPPLGQHPRDLLPNRLIVVWPYTDMSDARWRFGWKFITLRQTADGVPTKLGLAHTEKWVAYLMKDAFFIKTLDFSPGEPYPDMGCNFETFSNDEMLEIESLSPLRIVPPGGSVSHTERWHLLGGIPQPHSLKQRDLAEWISPLLAQAGL